MISNTKTPNIQQETDFKAYRGLPDIVGHVWSVQYSQIVPCKRLILLKKSTTETHSVYPIQMVIMTMNTNHLPFCMFVCLT